MCYSIYRTIIYYSISKAVFMVMNMNLVELSNKLQTPMFDKSKVEKSALKTLEKETKKFEDRYRQLYFELYALKQKQKEELKDYCYTLEAGRFKVTCQNDKVRYYAFVKEIKVKNKNRTTIQSNYLTINGNLDITPFESYYEGHKFVIYNNEVEYLEALNKRKIEKNTFVYLKDSREIFFIRDMSNGYYAIKIQNLENFTINNISEINEINYGRYNENIESQTEEKWVEKEFDYETWSKMI